MLGSAVYGWFLVVILSANMRASRASWMIWAFRNALIPPVTVMGGYAVLLKRNPVWETRLHPMRNSELRSTTPRWGFGSSLRTQANEVPNGFVQSRWHVARVKTMLPKVLHQNSRQMDAHPKNIQMSSVPGIFPKHPQALVKYSVFHQKM